MYWPSDTARHDEERPTHRTLAEATRKRQREAPLSCSVMQYVHIHMKHMQGVIC